MNKHARILLEQISKVERKCGEKLKRQKEGITLSHCVDLEFERASRRVLEPKVVIGILASRLH